MTIYKTLVAFGSEELERKVNEVFEAKKGWKCQGGVSASITFEDNIYHEHYAQAMVKVITERTTGNEKD